MFKNNHLKNVTKFIKNNDEEGLNQYILLNLSQGKASSHDLEFLDHTYQKCQIYLIEEETDFF